jgi:hypothetical protein
MTLLGLLLMLVPISGAAQGLPGTKSDPAAMNYRLTMPKLRKLVDVQRTLNALNASNPELFEKMDSEVRTAARKNGAPLTAAQRAAILDRYPDVKRVFTRAGWTSRDWVLTGEAMGNAFLAHEVMKGRLSPGAAPRPRTAAQKANIALLESNQTEWRRIQEELERLAEEL